VIDIIPYEIKEIHGKLFLALNLLLSLGSFQRILVVLVVVLPASRRINNIEVGLVLLEDVESDGKFEGDTCIYLDDEQNSRNCAYHAAHKRKYR